MICALNLILCFKITNMQNFSSYENLKYNFVNDIDAKIP